MIKITTINIYIRVNMSSHNICEDRNLIWQERGKISQQQSCKIENHVTSILSVLEPH